MGKKKLTLWEVNEFNKSIKTQENIIDDQDKNKIIENSTKRLEELREELNGIEIRRIQNNGELVARDWLTKEFLEQEIVRNEESFSKANNEIEEADKALLELRVKKEEMLRDLNLREAQTEIKLADLQKAWNEATSALNKNLEEMRHMNPESQEYEELEAKNEEYRKIMLESSLTSKKGTKLKNELDDIKTMKNILKSGEILEGLKEPKNKSNTNRGKTVKSGKVQGENDKLEEEQGIDNQSGKAQVENNKGGNGQRIDSQSGKAQGGNDKGGDSEGEKRKVIKDINLKWHPKLTEEQIEDAISRGIYEPNGQEYEQFLMEHGINTSLEKSELEEIEVELVETEEKLKKDSVFGKLKSFFKRIFNNISKRIKNVDKKLLDSGTKENTISLEESDREKFAKKLMYNGYLKGKNAGAKDYYTPGSVRTAEQNKNFKDMENLAKKLKEENDAQLKQKATMGRERDDD